MKTKRELIPEGTYRGEIVAGGLVDPGKKAPAFEITVALSGGTADSGEVVELYGQRRRLQVSLTAAGMDTLLANLRSMGYQGETLDRLAPYREDFFDLSGKQVRVRLTRRREGGRTSENLQLLPPE